MVGFATRLSAMFEYGFWGDFEIIHKYIMDVDCGWEIGRCHHITVDYVFDMVSPRREVDDHGEAR